jgi:hypothetical protein
MQRVRHLIMTGRPSKAVEMIEKALAFITKGAEVMATGPPVSWVHSLHQVTGLFALRGNRMSDGEKAKAIETLERVLEEMRDDRNWLQLPKRTGDR